jgi:hypothetical protein
MTTYHIVVDRDPPLTQSTMWIECDSDEIALREAVETLNANETGRVMEGDRKVGLIGAPPDAHEEAAEPPLGRGHAAWWLWRLSRCGRED